MIDILVTACDVVKLLEVNGTQESIGAWIGISVKKRYKTEFSLFILVTCTLQLDNIIVTVSNKKPVLEGQ